MSSLVRSAEDSKGTGLPAGPAAQILFVADETFRQSRGAAFWIIIGLGSGLALAGGAILTDAQGGGDVTALIFYVVLSILLTVGALAAGARGLARDRASGRRDLFGAQPIFGPAFFLGRFAGLAVRFGLAAVVLAALGGTVLTVTVGQSVFLRVTEPSRLSAGGAACERGDIVRLSPGGPGARWVFEELDRGGDQDGALRFSFRLRHPRRKPFQNNLPVRVTVRSGEAVLVDRELTVSLRREFTLPLGAIAEQNLTVDCSVAGGHNFMETGLSGCRLVRGESGPIVTLLAAAVSFVPLLWLILALALLFSAFVRETTAFLAASVLLLVTLAGPALQKDFALVAAGLPGGGHSHAAFHGDAEERDQPASPLIRFLARSAGGILSLFPDPGAGGAAQPLSRNECPSARDLTACWTEGLPHLALLLLIGCAIFSWRRP